MLISTGGIGRTGITNPSRFSGWGSGVAARLLCAIGSYCTTWIFVACAGPLFQFAKYAAAEPKINEPLRGSQG